MLATHENTPRQKSSFAAPITNILVPVNFSKRSANAASFALSLARRFHYTVTLLHVEKPIEGELFWTLEAARRVKKQIADFPPQSAGDPSIQRMVSMHSDVSDEVLRVAAEIGADLIVMSTNGNGAIRRALLGSVASRILQQAACPVLASAHFWPAAQAQGLHFERILCAVDSVVEGARILSWASALASDLNARLCVAWSRKGLTETREEIERLERKYRIYAEEVIETGKTSSALRRAAGRMQANLLVVDRKFWKSMGEPGLDMYQVVRESPCPVVSI